MWHDDREEGKDARLAKLRAFRSRPDAEEYTVVLRDILALFGEGIQESFERTMADYLESTDGKWALSKLSDHDIERAKDLIAHNNFAERPFAVMKALTMWPFSSVTC